MTPEELLSDDFYQAYTVKAMQEVLDKLPDEAVIMGMMIHGMDGEVIGALDLKTILYYEKDNHMWFSSQPGEHPLLWVKG